MQNEQQGNYWKQDSHDESSDEELDMYTPESVNEDSDEDNNYPQPIIEDAPVHWSAREYIHSEKNGLWFVLFALAVMIFIAVDLLWIKSYTFSVLVIVMSIAVIVYLRRPPQMIDYALSGDQGLYIGDRLYHFNEFKAFGLIRDGEHNSIMLIPIKRFNPGVSVYFPEEVGEEIVDILGARLPMEKLKLDMIDVIVRKLRL